MSKKIKTGIAKNKAKFNLLKSGEDLPSEILSGAPQIVLSSDKNALIEGKASIIEYDSSVVKIAFKSGFITFFGSDFIIKTFSDNRISFCGKIHSVEFTC